MVSLIPWISASNGITGISERFEIAKLVGMSRALSSVEDLEWARRASAGTLATHRR